MNLERGLRLLHFELIEKLGEGGMGVVWRALDTELNRHVAIKFLPLDLSGDEERRLRFRREAQAAAALNHPNIAVVHEVGEFEGTPFIVMECIQGQSLRDRLAAGALPTRQWLQLALPIAEALAHAHRGGIVHRDLKPDNVMITDEGQVKLLDFGLAKLMQPDEATGESRLETISRDLTRAGKVFGTVAYMSPEQARGETADPRSDLWALGVLIYEMAGGRLPFKATSDIETLSAVLQVAPEPLSHVGRDIPAEADRITRKALEKAPDDRYQHAADFVTDLRNLKRDLASGRATIPPPSQHAATTAGSSRSRWMPRIAAIAMLLILGAIAGFYSLRRGGAPAATEGTTGRAVQSVVVMPFESAGGGEDAGYLGDGIAESIINSLSRISALRVVPRSIAFSYRDDAAHPTDVGKELGVRAVVTGRVIQRGDSLVINAELIDVASVSQIWGEQYNRKNSDIFAIQEELTREIARNLELQLTPEEDREIAARPTDNPEAYDAYLRGEALAVFYSKAELERAREYFQQALEIDPEYARALAGLATVESMLYRNVEADPAMLRRAETYARRALEIDPNLARAHSALGDLFGVRYLYAEAVSEYEEALRLAPQEPSFHDSLSWALAYLTPPDGPRAEAEAREALRLAPRFAAAYYHLGRALLAQGRIDDAIEAFEYGGELDRSSDFRNLGLGQAYLAEGRYPEAIARFRDDSSKETPLVHIYLGAALLGTGDRSAALDLLEQAVAEGYGDFRFLAWSPWFTPLRDEPRFQALLP